MVAEQQFESLNAWSYIKFIDICRGLKRISPRRRQWIKLIKAGKLTCPVTGLKVHEVRLDVNRHPKGTFSYHYNFYSKCGKMFTVDHIHPKSKGGSKMHIDNLQPMIAEHNWEKGDKVLN